MIDDWLLLSGLNWSNGTRCFSLCGTSQDDVRGVLDAADSKLRVMMLPSSQNQLGKRSSSSASASGRHLPSTPVAIPPYLPSIPSSSSAVANFQVIQLYIQLHSPNGSKKTKRYTNVHNNNKKISYYWKWADRTTLSGISRPLHTDDGYSDADMSAVRMFRVWF